MLLKEMIDGTNTDCKNSHCLVRGCFGRAEGDTPQTYLELTALVLVHSCSRVCSLVETINKT